ncbi:hypothetical protein B0H21DRAFT_699461 [Amylocystis lapponica]|nr:hypothetical protein B0H21DRAFT_699461 [Amylocystis lapponica]
MAAIQRQPYQGTHRKLVLAFDIGTTYSGVSYAFLDPGEVPQTLGVRRFPGQEGAAGDSKIPSVLYYDKTGRVRAVGAEAHLQHNVDSAIDEDWVRIEWYAQFKLHLRPQSMRSLGTGQTTPLPPNKTIIDVLADFIRYIYTHAQRYIVDTHANGDLLLKSVEEHGIDFVFSHPNGWGGAQQDKMRQAVVLAGLIPDTAEGHARVQFVNEGEASVHYCVSSGLAKEALKKGSNVMVVDAGGGTVDVSTYVVKSDGPICLEEIVQPDCALEGSTIVTLRAREVLTARLSGSLFGDPEDIEEIVRAFDKTTKHTFKNPHEASYIKFGSIRDSDPDYGIKNGRLILPGRDVASLYEPSITKINTMIQNQQKAAGGQVSTIFLVGGFAASPWLFPRLKSFAHALDIKLSRPDHTNKAVADGALSFYLDHFVSLRVARFTYGVQCFVRFDNANPDHLRRAHQGTRVSEETLFTRAFNMESKGLVSSRTISMEILCYKGDSPNPQWTDSEPSMFSTLCSVKADISHVPRVPLLGPKSTYHSQDFSVLLSFGMTELKAQLSWIEGVRALVANPTDWGIRSFPGQEDSAGDSKIPSVIYYDKTGRVRAVGAEAQQPNILELAEDEGWNRIEWFKLHLRPGGTSSDSGDIPKNRITPLPPNKTIVDVFADFIGYLYACTRTYITDTHASGALLWASVERNIDFVFSHPNGWGGPQQGQMRRAVINAGLVPDTQDGHSRVQFVTEGEASVHFCVRNGLATDAIRDGKNVMIVDAGGGTVDISTYAIKSGVRLTMEEIATPESSIRLHTQVFIAKLAGSRYGNAQDIEEMFKQFDRSAKPVFKSMNDPSYVRFGSMRDRDPDFGIRNGQLTLSGPEVASLFEPSVTAISDAIARQGRSASHSVVFLVGGFAASPWLFSQLKAYVERLGMSLARPDTHTNKAVAEGALSFYLDHFVSVRIARYTYGVEIYKDFNPYNAEHVKRSHRISTQPSGCRVITGAFHSVLGKGTQVSEETEYSRDLFRESNVPFDTNTIPIMCYKGTSSQPSWIDVDPHLYSTLCTVRADVSRVPRTPIDGDNGIYYRIDFSVVLSFGLTELTAHLRWKENVRCAFFWYVA